MITIPPPIRPQDIDCGSRDAWHGKRSGIVGASESPILCGHGYAGTSVWALWQAKTNGIRPDFPESLLKKMRIGQLMEPAIRRMFQEETGLEIHEDYPHVIRIHPEHEFIGCTLDGLFEHPEYGLCVAELKNISDHNAQEWDDDDCGPLKYQIQVQQQMDVMDVDHGALVALIGGERLVIKWQHRNERFVSGLVDTIRRFWRLVETGIEPPMDKAAASSDVLRLLHPNDDGTVVPMPDDAERWDARRDKLKALKSRIDKKIAEYDNLIKQAIGDATYGLLRDGSCYSWKTSNRDGYEVKPTTVRTLRHHKKLPKGAKFRPVEQATKPASHSDAVERRESVRAAS